MQPLPHVPKTFRDIVEADLRRAARLIIKIQDEIDWQFRIATREGDYHLAVTMPDDDGERAAMLGRVALFLAWKGALAYTLGVETGDPDAVYAVGISRSERHNCIARISRAPRPWTAANFSSVEWLAPDNISPVLVRLLSVNPRPLRPKDITGLQPWFGTEDKFPAVHIPSGAITGVGEWLCLHAGFLRSARVLALDRTAYVVYRVPCAGRHSPSGIGPIDLGRSANTILYAPSSPYGVIWSILATCVTAFTGLV